MAAAKRRIDVMVSSTTHDLGEHRRRIGEVISRFQMIPRIMDLDSTTGKDGVTYSLDLVDAVEIYILLLGFRYGYVPDDPRNPKQISITQMEYDRALKREAQGELCVLPFVMADDHLLRADQVETDPEKRRKLDAFRALVLDKQVSFFDDIDELEKSVMQAFVQSPCVQQRKETSEAVRTFVPCVGEVLAGRYIFEAKLGQGGNGEVWKVQERLPDGKSSRLVAVKLLKPVVSDKQQRVERFKQEISVACRLTHPHIIRTTHWGEIGSQFYAVMDYIAGQTLSEYITGRAFSDRETVQYLSQVAEALDAAHKAGIVHRDVKPENILVKDGSLHLGDFGLAISPEEDVSLSESGEWVGTKKYMAPEQWDNQPTTPQTDVYALGFIAYEMLTGEYPFDVSSHARLMMQHLNKALPSHKRLPDEMLWILRRATAKNPVERYMTATEFITELSHWQLDPANLDTKIAKYLDTLRFKIKGEVYEQLFVDLEGDIRQLLPPSSPSPDDTYADPYLDSLLRDFVVILDADHHAPQSDEQPNVPVPNILERLAQSERVVLVGEPGSGKTFTLRRLVMCYISRYAELQRVPVFVPLNAFTGLDAAGQPQAFVDYVKQQLGDALNAYYPRLVKEGRLVLLCDALNEMPRIVSGEGRELLPEVRDTLTQIPLFVVSCRVRDYANDLDNLKLERLEMRDMELPTIHEFIQKYLREDGPAFWERIGGSDDLFTFWREVREKGESKRFWQEDIGIPSYTSASGDNAWRKMWQGTKLIPLARNPYLARVICGLHRRQQLPTNRAELYQAFVVDLYEREQQHAAARQQIFPEREHLETFLTELAEHLQAKQTTVLKRASITGDVNLLQSALDASILTQEGENLRFTHQLLQEYFAAKTLAVRMYQDEDPRPLFGDEWWQIRAWRETALMLAEFTGEGERVARWLGRANPWLAVETLQRIRPDTGLENLSVETHEILVKSAQAKEKETNPQGRTAVYRVLGLFGIDNRSGVGLREDGLPDIEWCRILPGEYLIGGDSEAWNSFEEQIFPIQQEYWLAKYLVTYKQFQVFLDDPTGFSNDQWWEGLTVEYRKQAMDEQYFQYANHPRESVSWYQAMAFCQWLNTRYREKKLLPDGWEIRLPMEQEWEKAARGKDGLIYPYGNEFDPAKGNTRETGIGQTSAVGIFPNGASPYGILDMAGNVWEWCLNEYDNPENIDVFGMERRVLRGGSWYNSQRNARTASRDYSFPIYESNDLGFRVVAAPKADM